MSKTWRDSLCIHDPRNTEGCSCWDGSSLAGQTSSECPGRTPDCACGNCFYGRDALAEAIGVASEIMDRKDVEIRSLRDQMRDVLAEAFRSTATASLKIHPELNDAGYKQSERRLRRDNGVITWKCDGCELVALWSPSWSWHGSVKELEDCGTEAGEIRVACSDTCRGKARVP